MSGILQEYLEQHISRLAGPWVQRPNWYEADVCRALLMSQEKTRYWDARWNGHLLEFKKGRSIWLDLVRYSEILLRCNENACKEVYSLFFLPDDQRQYIEQI